MFIEPTSTHYPRRSEERKEVALNPNIPSAPPNGVRGEVAAIYKYSTPSGVKPRRPLLG